MNVEQVDEDRLRALVKFTALSFRTPRPVPFGALIGSARAKLLQVRDARVWLGTDRLYITKVWRATGGGLKPFRCAGRVSGSARSRSRSPEKIGSFAFRRHFPGFPDWRQRSSVGSGANSRLTACRSI